MELDGENLSRRISIVEPTGKEKTEDEPALFFDWSSSSFRRRRAKEEERKNQWSVRFPSAGSPSTARASNHVPGGDPDGRAAGSRGGGLARDCLEVEWGGGGDERGR